MIEARERGTVVLVDGSGDPTERVDRGAPTQAASTHADRFVHTWAGARAAWWAFAWAVSFTVLHGYWALGGRIGFGDQTDPLPAVTWDVRGTIFTVVVGAMFATGLAVPVALVRPWGQRFPRRALVSLMWFGAAILVVRGGLGLADDLLRIVGSDRGLTGLSDERALGSADPTAYTQWSSVAVDTCFVTGGLLFGWSAHRSRVPVSHTGDAAEGQHGGGGRPSNSSVSRRSSNRSGRT